MTWTYDAAVIGAGVAGSALAKVLAEAGWNTVLIDQDTFPRHKVCGEFLSPESKRILTSLGLDGVVQALGPREIMNTRIVLASGESIELPLPGVAFGVSRYKLDHALHRSVRLLGGEVLEGTQVKSIKQKRHSYMLHVRRNGEEKSIHTRTVIAAWGRNPRAGLPGEQGQKRAHSSFIGIKAHLSDLTLDNNVELYFFSGGYLGVSPVEDGYANIAALLTREAFEKAGKTIPGVFKLAALQCPKLKERLAGSSIISNTQVATAPVDTNRRTVAWSQMAHVGDAATMIPPLCGDGMAIALYSAEICFPFVDEYLKGTITLEQWERQYTAALHREVSNPIRLGRYLQYMLGSPILSKLAIRLGSVVPGFAIKLIESTRIKR